MTINYTGMDVDVFSRDMLDEDDARLFDRPWLVSYPNGLIVCFDDEDTACAVQRAHRECCGLDPLTGEPKED